jgi:Family of unknown function (DUF6349)
MTRRARQRPEGPDLFDMLEEAKLERPAPCLYRTGTAAGLIGRLAEFDAWADEHGRFGCVPRSHGWHGWDIPPVVHLNRAYADMLLDRCQPAILTADLRRWPRTAPVPACGCDGPLLYRAACRGRGCLWESPEHGRENPAAEDGMDHAWPGWRDLPVIAAPPHYLNGAARERQEAAWLARVSPAYPPGWIEAGGPIRTRRAKYATRHVPGWTPFGGYDMAVPAAGEEGDG